MRKMIPNPGRHFLAFLLAAICLTEGTAWSQVKNYTPGEYPAPRTPDYNPNVTVEDLLPAARVLVRKPAKRQPLEPGYAVKPGQHILILVTSTFDDRVLEAIRLAIEEVGGRPDIMKTWTAPSARVSGNRGFEEFRVFKGEGAAGTANRPPRFGFTKGLQALGKLTANGEYTLVINGAGGPPPMESYDWEYIPWDTADQFLFSQAGFPYEVQYAMDRKAYSTLLRARKIRATDPEGTDMAWNWHPNYEGINREEHPGYEFVLAGHLGAIPQFHSPLDADANGTIAGTINHTGTFPRLALTITKNQIAKVAGGGEYGRLWQEMLEACRGIQFPGFPAPGCGWFEEAAIGSDVWRARSLDFAESIGGASWERGRAGVIHWGLGVARNLDAVPAVRQWHQEHETPSGAGHWHVHTYFTTMDFTLDDGKQLRVIDKGHFTWLDDPEIRQIASKYGNPDEILREKWIPAVPGINIPGNYLSDYAADPFKVISAQMADLLKKIRAAGPARHELQASR